MGIRMTQVYGLNEAAQSLVTGELVPYEEEVVRRYGDGRVEQLERSGAASLVRSEPSGRHFMGMFEGEEYELMRYHLPDGRVVEEREYASPWSSGPCIFLALVEASAPEWDPSAEAAYRDYGRPAPWVRESVWSDREIAESI